MYAYDLTISPVHYEDRGQWKCEVFDRNGLGDQSAVGDLDVEVPLTALSLKSDDDSGALIVDEKSNLKILCETSPATPPPDSLQIFVHGKRLENVQVQRSTPQTQLHILKAMVTLKNVPRSAKKISFGFKASFTTIF